MIYWNLLSDTDELLTCHRHWRTTPHQQHISLEKILKNNKLCTRYYNIFKATVSFAQLMFTNMFVPHATLFSFKFISVFNQLSCWNVSCKFVCLSDLLLERKKCDSEPSLTPEVMQLNKAHSVFIYYFPIFSYIYWAKLLTVFSNQPTNCPGATIYDYWLLNQRLFDTHPV